MRTYGRVEIHESEGTEVHNTHSWLLEPELFGYTVLSYIPPDTIRHLFSLPTLSCALSPTSWMLHPLPSMVAMVTQHHPQLAPVAVIRERPVFSSALTISLHSGETTTCAVELGKVFYLSHKITLGLHHWRCQMAKCKLVMKRCEAVSELWSRSKCAIRVLISVKLVVLIQ